MSTGETLQCPLFSNQVPGCDTPGPCDAFEASSLMLECPPLIPVLPSYPMTAIALVPCGTRKSSEAQSSCGLPSSHMNDSFSRSREVRCVATRLMNEIPTAEMPPVEEKGSSHQSSVTSTSNRRTPFCLREKGKTSLGLH